MLLINAAVVISAYLSSTEKILITTASSLQMPTLKTVDRDFDI